MKQNIKYLVIFLLLSYSFLKVGIAQESYLLKELRIPQVAQENPGAVIPYDAHVCFPALGKIHIGANSFLAYGDLMSISNKWLDGMKNNNPIRLWVEINPIHFGFRVKKNYFSITTAITSDFSLSFQKDFFSFAIQGNAPFSGNTLSLLDKDFLSFNLYAEVGLGYNREINDNISFGLNVKYLSGLLNAHTSKAELLLHTGKNYHQIDVEHTMDVKMAGIVDIEDIDVNNITKNFKNHGFAFDVGGRYRIHKLVEVSASVLDIGFIKWKTNVKQYSVDKRTFTVVGLQYDDVINDSSMLSNIVNPNAYLSKITDSISNSLFSELENGSSYTKWLNLRFNVGASLYASPNDRFNFTFVGKFFNGVFMPSGCVSYHRTCGRWFDIAVGNTFKSNALFNPGVGMNLTLEVFQLYLAVDYTNIIPYIDRAKNLNVALGINFVAPLNKTMVYKASYPY